MAEVNKANLEINDEEKSHCFMLNLSKISNFEIV